MNTLRFARIAITLSLAALAGCAYISAPPDMMGSATDVAHDAPPAAPPADAPSSINAARR